MNEPQGRRKLASSPIPREEPSTAPTDSAPAGRRMLKVSWGEENFHPVAYNGFKCGGLELVVEVPPNQTVEECYEQTYARLDAIAAKQFEQKLNSFITRLRTAGQAVKVSAASSK